MMIAELFCALHIACPPLDWTPGLSGGDYHGLPPPRPELVYLCDKSGCYSKGMPRNADSRDTTSGTSYAGIAASTSTLTCSIGAAQGQTITSGGGAGQ